MQLFAWGTVKKEVMNEKIWRKVVSGERAMAAQVFIAKGGLVPTHQHESEQISYIIAGALKFELEGKEVVVRSGEVLRIPSNVPHLAVALEDTFDMDIFSPIRLDWLTGKDDYLRTGVPQVVKEPPLPRSSSRNTTQLFAWETVQKIVMNDRISRQVISGEKGMVGLISLARGALVPRHQHESEQLTCIQKGALKFDVEGKEVVVRAGEVLYVPSNAPHGATAVEDTLNLEVFAPPRPDWLT